MLVFKTFTVEGRAFKYEGPVSYVWPEGKGRIVGPSGQVYEGYFGSKPWPNYAWCGITRDQNSSLLENYQYEIQYFSKDNALSYTGDYLHGKRHGWGVFTLIQGSYKAVYEGEFKNDMMCGQFIKTFQGKQQQQIWVDNVQQGWTKEATEQILAEHAAQRAAAEQNRLCRDLHQQIDTKRAETSLLSNLKEDAKLVRFQKMKDIKFIHQSITIIMVVLNEMLEQ